MTFKTYICILMSMFHMSLSSTANAQNYISDDDFFDREEYGEFHLSPDGKHIAVSDFREDKSKLLLFDIDDGLAQTHIDIDQENAIVLWATWATNKRLLVRVLTTTNMKLPRGLYVVKDGKRSKTLKDIPVARMMAIDIDGSNPITFFEDANEKIEQNFSHAHVSSVLPQDPDHVLIPLWDGKMSLYKVNIHTGDYKRIERGKSNTNGWNITPEGHIVARYDAADNGRYVKIYTRAPGEKKWDRLAKVREEELKSFSPIAPASSLQTYYVSARPEGHDKLGVFEYNLKEKRFIESTSTHPTVDLFGAVTDANGQYVGAAYIEDRVTYDFVDKSLGKHIDIINAHFDNERNVTIENISTDGKRWLVLAMGPRHPGSYYIYDSDSSSVKLVAETNTTLKPEMLGVTERIAYQASDGTDLFGYLTKPAQITTSTPPLIVLPHGGPEARDYMQFDPMVQYFSTRGYQVFQPNFRGSSGFGEKFAKSGYGEWAGLMLDDISDGVDHLIATGKTDKDKICIAGASYGGYAALMASLRSPDKYKCAVSINGVTDLASMLEYSKDRYGKKSDVYSYHVRAIGDPEKDQEEIAVNSPLTHASKFKLPLLVLHAERDRVVPQKQSHRFAVAVRKSGGNVRYFPIERSDHNLTGTANYGHARVDNDNFWGFKVALAEMRVFFRDNLK